MHCLIQFNNLFSFWSIRSDFYNTSENLIPIQEDNTKSDLNCIILLDQVKIKKIIQSHSKMHSKKKLVGGKRETCHSILRHLNNRGVNVFEVLSASLF